MPLRHVYLICFGCHVLNTSNINFGKLTCITRNKKMCISTKVIGLFRSFFKNWTHLPTYKLM